MSSRKSPVASHQIISGALIVLLLGGCAGVKEAGRGIAGTSTRILEDHINDALVREYTLDTAAARDRARRGLLATGSYIYREEKAKQLIAVYVSEADTTPVGLFFEEADRNRTRIRFSSPSTYAKELIAERVDQALSAK